MGLGAQRSTIEARAFEKGKTRSRLEKGEVASTWHVMYLQTGSPFPCFFPQRTRSAIECISCSLFVTFLPQYSNLHRGRPSLSFLESPSRTNKALELFRAEGSENVCVRAQPIARC